LPRILALDYGSKRTGLAVTDPLQIICSPLETVETPKLLDYLTAYCRAEPVEKIVVGQPVHADGTPTYLEEEIQRFLKSFAQVFPDIPVARQDETLTSKRAAKILVQSGLPKKKRQQKERLDKISAVLILEDHLGWHP
jgi:putative Holliday junction resolvase